MNPITKIFQFGDGGVHDAGVSEVSEAIKICFNYAWLLVPISAGLNDAPVYSFEVSNDNINWQEFDPLTLNAAITQPFQKSILPGIWFRINYDAQANTTGTVSFNITLKP
jgi:hypothetical protein